MRSTKSTSSSGEDPVVPPPPPTVPVLDHPAHPIYVLPGYTYPPWDQMAINQGVPYLLGALVSSLQPQLVVEAGTYRGHAAVTIALTLQSIKRGHLHTADPMDHGVAALFQEQRLTEYATYHQATYEDMLNRVAPRGGIDMAFVDASGSPDDRTMRTRHLFMSLERLAVGGLVIMDDIAATDWPYVNVIRGMAQLYFPGMRGIAIFQKRC